MIFNDNLAIFGNRNIHTGWSQKIITQKISSNIVIYCLVGTKLNDSRLFFFFMTVFSNNTYKFCCPSWSLFNSIICLAIMFVDLEKNQSDARLGNSYKVKVYVRFCEKCMELVEFFKKEQTFMWWNIERFFGFMLPGRLQKYLYIYPQGCKRSLYLLLTFKELILPLLDSSVKLLRFLIIAKIKKFIMKKICWCGILFL